ncbi:MAG: hypothetical protein ACKOI0_04380 [Actinomycetota bacterium]
MPLPGSRAARGWVAATCAATMLLAGAAGWAIVVGAPTAGALTLVAGGTLVAVAAAARRDGRTGSPRERVLVALADRTWDGAVLGSLVWANRIENPGLAAAVLWCFALSALAAYARTRGVALGYALDIFALTSVVRVGVTSLAVLLGWGTTPFVGLAVWLAGSALVRASQVWKEGLA